MTSLSVSLDDKYQFSEGRVFMSGIQALVRLPMLQRERDRRGGFTTAGFVTGYRGSPMGGYDTALRQAERFLKAHDVVFKPGLNEDLAATALWGTQQLSIFDGANVDGVFGIWYGKGPGVDRSMDVLKHANAAGTSPRGGVLAVAADDHAAQSSTLAHQSEQMFASAMIPVLAPASVEDYLEFGLFGFAMSRFTGCWVGLKAVGPTVESSASVRLPDPDRAYVVPADFAMPSGGLNIRRPDPPLALERRLHGPKMEAVTAFARANAIDRVVIDGPNARFGIASAGKAYADVREALQMLGLDERAAAQFGIRVYRIGMSWPLEVDGVRKFAAGLEEVLVVEEKRSLIEDQFARTLYHLPASVRPRLVGKTDLEGSTLLPSLAELSPVLIARRIGERLLALGIGENLKQRLTELEAIEVRRDAIVTSLNRAPYFCAGCPHNTSTRLPEGSRAMAGIGCHGMIVTMPERNTHIMSQMGGEGAAWIGQAPFTREAHVFQNLGDGTYSHSGLLAIRAAIAAGVNITYKILYNDAVAMTGGQATEAGASVAQITRQMAAEGAARIVVVADQPEKYTAYDVFAPGVTVHPRIQLDRLQRELRETRGVTILIYDQVCAAEKRRRRKRGTFPDPDKRLFINAAVCEGCGDCSVQSNCIAVQPLDTPLGRKRRIDQSSCNKDYSCETGFCPSFVTVKGARLRKVTTQLKSSDLPPDPPEPVPSANDEPWNIVVAGIGGTGVITLGALLGMAAHIEGKACSVLDNTGLAQKNGAVSSHVRIVDGKNLLNASRVPAGSTDLLLACDMVVAAMPEALGTAKPGRTRIVANGSIVPTAAFVTNNALDLNSEATLRQLRESAAVEVVDAGRLATRLLGDAIATNLFMLGFAFQRGLIPLNLASIMRAIELNDTAVEASKAGFAWGRRTAGDLPAVERLAFPHGQAPSTPLTISELVADRVRRLTDYQNERYAKHFQSVVQEVSDAEVSHIGAVGDLTRAVAENLYSLMAYKDEYEVARLYTDKSFLDAVTAQFDGDYTLEFNLAPPLLSRRSRATGLPMKQAFGGWIMPVFRLLARLKGLRGTAFDIFGYTIERKQERRLIAEYERDVRSLLATLTKENRAAVVAIARLPERIKGFGHVKAKNVSAAAAERSKLLAAEFVSPNLEDVA